MQRQFHRHCKLIKLLAFSLYATTFSPSAVPSAGPETSKPTRRFATVNYVTGQAPDIFKVGSTERKLRATGKVASFARSVPTDETTDEMNPGPPGGRVVIAGLGPGNPSYLTRAVWDEICSSSEVFARIGRHPALSAVPDTVKLTTFESYYEEAETFEFLYSNISNRILELAKEHGKVLYLVPGDPWVGETTTKLITSRSSSCGVQVDILPGISFVEPTLAALKVDLLPRLLVGDSYELVSFQHLPLECNTPLLISQLEDQFEASALKVVLMTSFSPEHVVALVHAAGSAECKVEWLPLHRMDQCKDIGIMTSLYVPAANGSFSQLRDAFAKRREDIRDVWDDITHEELSAGLLKGSEALLAVSKDPPRPSEVSESLARILAFTAAHLQLGEDDNDFTTRDIISRASQIVEEIGD